MPSRNPCSSSTSSLTHGPVIEVNAVRVDDYVPAGTTVSLLKVDTEGADAWALMGCQRLLEARAIDEIWFEEFKPRAEALGIAPGAGATFLRSLGYSVTAQGDPAAEMVEWCALRPSAGSTKYKVQSTKYEVRRDDRADEGRNSRYPPK